MADEVTAAACRFFTEPDAAANVVRLRCNIHGVLLDPTSLHFDVVSAVIDNHIAEVRSGT